MFKKKRRPLFPRPPGGICFLDTETVGLPLKPETSYKDYPEIIQMAYIMVADSIVTKHGQAQGCPPVVKDYLIKPYYDFSETHRVAEKVHGITRDHAKTDGEHLEDILKTFIQELVASRVHTIVAHNAEFDISALKKAFIASQMEEEYNRYVGSCFVVCTMRLTTYICCLPFPPSDDESDNSSNVSNSSDYKWPTLVELHRYVFRRDFENAHDAMVDVNALLKCVVYFLNTKCNVLYTIMYNQCYSYQYKAY